MKMKRFLMRKTNKTPKMKSENFFKKQSEYYLLLLLIDIIKSQKMLNKLKRPS